MNRTLRDIGTGLLIAITTAGLVLGALSLSRSEGGGPASGQASETHVRTPQIITATLTQPAALVSATVTLPFGPQMQLAGATSALTYSTRTYASGTCGPPANWVQGYTVQPGDTLYLVANANYTTVSAIQQANCKGTSTSIFTGELLWVPYIATRTPDSSFIYDSPTPYATDPLTETPLPFTETPLPFTVTPVETPT